jgi:hypothetical protein
MTRVAICYWGLTRSTRHVADSHHAHIFAPLSAAGIEFDVFLHTWEAKDHYIWWVKTHSSPDYTEHELLHPVSFRRDSQDEFLDGIDFSQYYYSEECEWNPLLLRNHICSLESQRRVTEMCIESNRKYSHVMYVRPDARIYSDLPVSQILELSGNEILLPDENHYEGYNDRFAAMTYDACLSYGTRINGLAEFRERVGYIVSEKYVKYVVDKHYIPLFCEFKFRLVRPFGDEV